MIDVLVAGAGPTGLSAAIAAAQRGASVVVVDPQPGTVDKACGEGLMPATVDSLAALGVTPHGRPFTGIRYLRGDVVAHAPLPAPGLGVRRTALHDALSARADALGIRREVGRVTDIVQHADHVDAAGFRARWLIAADGLRSPIRHHLGLDRPSRWPRRYGLRRHVRMAPWSDTVDVFWADDAEAYVTPVDDDLVGIAFLFGDAARDADRPAEGNAFDRLLARFPALRDRLGDAPPASTVRGAGPFATRSARRVAGRVLLVGDAAGYLDAITGEGLKLGVLGAREAVDAALSGHPVRWERSWRRLYRPYALATGGLLLLSRLPALRRALPRLARDVPFAMRAAVATIAG